MIGAFGIFLVYSSIKYPTAAERQGAKPPAVNIAILCLVIDCLPEFTRGIGARVAGMSTDEFDLDADIEAFSCVKAEKLTTKNERRLYLTSCWLEALCTAEARVLGWIYQEIYGRTYSP